MRVKDGIEQAGVEQAALSLSDELQLHQTKASEAAALIAQLIFIIPNKLNFRGGMFPRNPDFPPDEVVEPFLRYLENVVKCLRGWPEPSQQAALALAPEAGGPNRTAVQGVEGSCVLAIARVGRRLVQYAETLKLDTLVIGETEEVIVARHLAECRADYPSSKIAEWIGDINFDKASAVIDGEIAAAITWSKKHLTDPDVSAPAELSEEARSASTAGKRTGSQDMVIDFLVAHHYQHGMEPLQGKAIAKQANASQATVTRAIKRIFGEEGYRAYFAACEQGTVNDKLDAHTGDGIAFGTVDPTIIDQIENLRGRID